MNTTRIFKILYLALAFSFEPLAFAQVQWTATTDTNGNFTWPPHVNSANLTPFTNTIYIYSTVTSTVPVIVLGTNGTATFTQTNGNTFNIGSTYFSFQTPYGSLTYSNGEIYNVVGASTNAPFPTMASITNLQLEVTNLALSLLALSNQMQSYNFSGATNWLASLQATNATLQTNYAALAGTNGINATNFAYALFWSATNYANVLGQNLTNSVNLIGNNWTNYASAIGLAVSNYAAGLFLSTNAIATHFRFGVASVYTNFTSITFAPPFNDPSYYVYLSEGGTGFFTNAVYGFPSAYNQFQVTVQGSVAVGGLNYYYMLYHP